MFKSFLSAVFVLFLGSHAYSMGGNVPGGGDPHEDPPGACYPIDWNGPSSCQGKSYSYCELGIDPECEWVIPTEAGKCIHPSVHGIAAGCHRWQNQERCEDHEEDGCIWTFQ